MNMNWKKGEMMDVRMRNAGTSVKRIVLYLDSADHEVRLLPTLFIIRIWRVLMMVYYTQNHWVLGLCPSPEILNNSDLLIIFNFLWSVMN
jgi:hypothetical protein